MKTFLEAFPPPANPTPSEPVVRSDRELMLDPDSWYEFYGGRQSSAGALVNEETALSLAAFYRCVKLLSNDAARTPMDFLEKVGERGREPVTGDPRRQLCRMRGNPRQHATGVRRTLVAQWAIWGDAFAVIDRRGDGLPRALYPIPSRDVEVRWGVEPGERWYFYTPRDRAGERSNRVQIPETEVVHLRDLEDSELLRGVNPVQRLRQVIGLSKATDDYAADFYSNGGAPGVILKPPHKTSAQERRELASDFDRAVSGRDRRHRSVMIPRGFEVTDWNLSQEAAQYIETKGVSRVDIANIFGVPPHLVGDDSRVSYNSLEQENQSYLDRALDPILVMLESEFDFKLLTIPEQDRGRRYFRFRRSALVRASFEETRRGLAIEVQNSILSPAEARELLDRPAGPDYLESFLRPAGTPAGSGNQPPASEAPAQEGSGEESAGESSERSALAAAAAREVLTEAVLRSVRRVEKQSDEKLREDRNRLVIESMLRPAVRASALLLEGVEESELLDLLATRVLGRHTSSEVLHNAV